MNLPTSDAVANLPVDELRTSLDAFLAPLTERLPDRRLKRVARLAVFGLLSSRAPIVTRIAAGLARKSASVWPLSKRLYRFLANPRLNHRDLLKGMCIQARQSIEQQEQKEYLVVALDPVHLEKPYTQSLEGVSTVYKSVPPGPGGQKRLTPGYPALTTAVVNLPQPVTCYAHWFSYRTADFVSENRELVRAIRSTRAVLKPYNVRFVADSGLDDQKMFRHFAASECDFIVRAGHLERHVEIYNQRLDRWETETLGDLADTLPLPYRFQAAFQHAGKTRLTTLHLGWFPFRIPQTQQYLWALVSYDPDKDRRLVLITNINLRWPITAKQVLSDWKLRTRIEHVYRFDQEQGFQVEDMRVATLERMRRMFLLVVLAASFVYFIDQHWPKEAIYWLRMLGGKLGLRQDRDGPYLLLTGITAVLTTWTTLKFVTLLPFPKEVFRCG